MKRGGRCLFKKHILEISVDLWILFSLHQRDEGESPFCVGVGICTCGVWRPRLFLRVLRGYHMQDIWEKALNSLRFLVTLRHCDARSRLGSSFPICFPFPSQKPNLTNVSIWYLWPHFVAPQQEDCEKAYFKMDNVLIDDRRIHVDFSQSVAKIKWKGKGDLSPTPVWFARLEYSSLLCRTSRFMLR